MLLADAPSQIRSHGSGGGRESPCLPSAPSPAPARQGGLRRTQRISGEAAFALCSGTEGPDAARFGVPLPDIERMGCVREQVAHAAFRRHQLQEPSEVNNRPTQRGDSNLAGLRARHDSREVEHFLDELGGAYVGLPRGGRALHLERLPSGHSHVRCLLSIK